MIRTALVLLLAPLGWVRGGQADRAEKLYEQVKFGSAEFQDDDEKRVVALVGSKVHWVGAFRTIEEKIGPWPEDLPVEVTFDLAGEEPSKAGYREKKGFIQFNLKWLAQYLKKVDDAEQRKKELAKLGKRAVFKVTPLRIERLVYHELTCVLQRDGDLPKWFRVGMASWIGDDSNYVTAFANSGKKVETIEAPLPEYSDLFGRGHSFWKWLDSKGAAKRAAKAVVLDKVPWKKALEDATGLPWDKLTAVERDWSEKQFDKIRAATK